MGEGYDEWHRIKATLDALVNFPRPKRRQVWWCVIGLNVGSEQSCTKGFDRPVLVVKVFGSMFWGLPITSSDTNKKKDKNPLFYRIEGTPYVTNDGKEKKLEGYVALHQLRAFDSRRLKRKILRMENDLFDRIEQELKNLL